MAGGVAGEGGGELSLRVFGALCLVLCWGCAVALILFQNRFADLVRTRKKQQTIRKKRLLPITVGDPLVLRMWSGLPRRSRQITLLTAVCRSVQPIYISSRVYTPDHYGVRLDGEFLPRRRAEALARADGFESVEDMCEWFIKTHGLPFEGVLITW